MSTEKKIDLDTLYPPQYCVEDNCLSYKKRGKKVQAMFHNAFLLSYQNGDLCLLVVEMTGILLVSFVLLIGAYHRYSGHQSYVSCERTE